MGPFDLKNLKKITIDVTQNITAISSTSNSVEYNVLSAEDILIKRRAGVYSVYKIFKHKFIKFDIFR